MMWNSPGHKDFLEWVHDPVEEVSLRCAQYWSNVCSLPSHAALDIPVPSMTVPISWHMDGVKVFKTQKVWAYSFASCIRKGTSIATKSLFLLFRDSDMIKPWTHDSVGKLIAYVMKTLQTGCFPTCDYDGSPFEPGSTKALRAGTPFAGGWRGVFACFKADLEGRVLAHKLVRNWASDSVCERCIASKLPQSSYGDFSDAAVYWDCMFSHEQFLMLNPPGKTSVWVDVPGWDISRNLDVSRHLRAENKR